jgi:hypothetical protein
MPSEPRSVTVLLRLWREGDSDSLTELVPLVEGELRKIAHRHLRSERQGHVLQTTALLNAPSARLERRTKHAI